MRAISTRGEEAKNHGSPAPNSPYTLKQKTLNQITFNLLNLQPSTFNLQPSTFNLQPSKPSTL
ncbi:hypothetical protein [Moorena bouillonii]|uniref:hypothetical protein n=1 Tax=Moorena bouillonii TaxID=207920 RepID=UPI00117D5558|nr:hypothetical protein [Moorena bouillonii]